MWRLFSQKRLTAGDWILVSLVIGALGYTNVKALTGNSFTGNTMPGLHPLLGESAGKKWTVEASIAPGIPIWAHMKKQMDRGPDYEKFQKAGPETDAIVMLIFGGDGLSSIVTEKWQGEAEEVIGVLTISYDHHQRELAERVMTIQHECFVNVLCSTHVHLDHHECLEVIILRGRPREVEKLSSEIGSLKGVKLSRLTKACRVEA